MLGPFWFVVAAIPGLFVWWDTRRLRPHFDDPALPHLLVAHANRTTKVLVPVWVVLLVYVSKGAAALALVSLLGIMVGRFPARRELLEERWSFLEYLDHHLKLYVGLFGPWFVVLFSPLLFLAAPAYVVPIGIVLCGVVLLWSVFNTRVLLWLLQAERFTDPQFDPFFAGVTTKATCPSPTVYCAGPARGRWVNAFAVLNPRAPAVLLTRDLMNNLTVAEATAIFAHEIAHLERNPMRSWVLRSSAAPITVLIGTLIFSVAASAIDVLLLAWPVLCLGGLVVASRRSKTEETRCDLRGVELAGDPEAMIGGLTRIYRLNLQPRRIDAQIEERSTHPSLARRIQAIRQATGTAGRATDGTLTVRDATDGSRAVLFSGEEIQWLREVTDQAPYGVQSGSASYGELGELRVGAPRPNRRELVVVDSHGSRTTMPLTKEDAELVHDFLDGVDAHLGDKPVVRTVLSPARARTLRILGLLSLLAALVTPTSVAMLLASAVLGLWPSTAALVATGLTGFGGLLSAVVSGVAWMDLQQTILPTLMQALVSGLVLSVAVVRSRMIRESPRAGVVVAAVLGVVGGIVLLMRLRVLGGPLPAMHLHLWVRTVPASLLLIAASVTVLLTGRAKRVRVAGLAFLPLIALLLFAGTPWFRETSSADSLRELPSRTDIRPMFLSTLRRASFDGVVRNIQLSPSGRRVAVSVFTSAELADPLLTQFIVESESGATRIEAQLLQWIDDESVVVLTSSDSGSALQRRASATHVDWEIQLPLFVEPELTIDGENWSVQSRDLQSGGFRVFSGRLGSPTVRTRHWVGPVADDIGIESFVGDTDDAAVLLGRRAAATPTSLVGRLFETSGVTELWHVARDRHVSFARTAFDLACPVRSSLSATNLCVARADGLTELWLLDRNAMTFSPVGRFPG